MTTSAVPGRFSLVYLVYNTISNVLKVRHDSAKAAINNIR